MKMLSVFAIGGLSALLLCGCATIHPGWIDLRTTEHLRLSADDLSDLEVESRQGYLIIEGEDNRTEIEVIAYHDAQVIAHNRLS